MHVDEKKEDSKTGTHYCMHLLSSSECRRERLLVQCLAATHCQHVVEWIVTDAVPAHKITQHTYSLPVLQEHSTPCSSVTKIQGLPRTF